MLAELKEAELKGVKPRVFIICVAVKFEELNGINPKAVVISEAEIENIAVKEERPVLSKVNTLVDAVLSENEMLFTKLFAFVPPVTALIVTEVAVVERVTLVPATKFKGPKGT